MGFCRRCGDIVTGERCHCGGASVAPVVSWRNPPSSTTDQDRWCKTYVSSSKAATPALERSSTNSTTGAVASALSTLPIPNSNTSKRFPRPLSFSSAPPRQLKASVSDHIRSTISNSTRPPSPLKISTTLSDAENDILPSFHPNEPSLSKVYGSLLQPTDTLPLHSCARCSSVFPPDATIYPDPSPSNTGSFLCRNCFTVSGGSKGTCPACLRPVLILKSEGGFIHSGGQYWHKKCYNCAGCFKNIGDAPMVDLLGRPSCVECFDNCLKGASTPKGSRTSNNISPNPGGMNANFGKKSRESSPAIEELEYRLGLAKSHQGSPINSEASRNRQSPRRSDTSPGKLASPSSLHTRRDVFGENVSNSSGTGSPKTSGSPGRVLNAGMAATRTENSIPLCSLQMSPSRPPLEGPRSTTLSASSAGNYASGSPDSILPIGTRRITDPKGVSDSHELSSTLHGLSLSNSICGQCKGRILKARDGGQFVTVPGADENTIPQFYHSECFKCVVCDKAFSDARKGQLSFVRADVGPCHTQCAPTNHYVIRKSPSVRSLNSLGSNGPTLNDLSPTRKQIGGSQTSVDVGRPPTPQRSPSKPTFALFGGQNSCPGCQKAVSLMERGVVPGPQGTRWHALCLVCGGRKEPTRAVLLGRSRDERKRQPGCGKRLDSAAKSDGEGRVWCRECLLLLGNGGSPTRSPLIPAFTGGSPTKVAPQFTGIARQTTGLGASDAILRQFTGGGLSPTRSISPTKQLGMMGPGGHIRPRPKSVIGIRGAKSIDEGRGMYLVRQLTGVTTNGGAA